MLHKYCPSCASLRVTPLNGGREHKCGYCDYQGEVKEDSIEKINDIKKIIQNKSSESDYSTYPLNNNDIQEKPDLKDKIKRISEKSSKDWELL